MSKNRKLKPEEKVDIVRRWQAGEISIHAASQRAGAVPKKIRRCCIWQGDNLTLYNIHLRTTFKFPEQVPFAGFKAQQILKQNIG